MSTSAILKLLKDYALTNESRKNINRPWLDKGFLKATNGHILIIVSERLCPGHQVIPNEKAPVTDFITNPEGRTFSPLDLVDLISVVDSKHDEYSVKSKGPCEECDGAMVVPCPHCGNGTMDCLSCGGTGVTEYNAHGKPIPEGPHSIDFLGRRFNYRYIEMLRSAVLLFEGAWEFSLGQANPGLHTRPAALFRSPDGVVVALMEMRI